MAFLLLFFKKVYHFPAMFYYYIYDKLLFIYFRKIRLFPGWGIHLYTGKFGQGKTSSMTIKAYKLACKYPQLHILTNINLTNFPKHTAIIPLRTANDILNAPENTLVLIDEIGTLFNSRDFSSGKNSVPKPVFQHLCQCRKRHMQIFGTVQRFNLLDKQIRDITATVTDCSATLRYPFSRMFTEVTYDIEEYEAWTANRMYNPTPSYTSVVIQTDQYRQLYDTTQLIQGLLTAEYEDDETILRNQGTIDSCYIDGTKEALKAYRKGVKRGKR